MYTKELLSACPVLPIQRGFSQFVAALESLDWLFTDGASYGQRELMGNLKQGTGIRFQKCIETGFYWFGSGKCVGCGPHANDTVNIMVQIG